MSDYEKAQCIIYAMMRFSCVPVFLQPEDVLRKCNSEELNFYYYKLYRRK